MPQIFANAVHIIPHGDRTVAVGSTSEREFEEAHGTDAKSPTAPKAKLEQAKQKLEDVEVLKEAREVVANHNARPTR